MAEPVKWEIENQIARLTLSEPERGNTLGTGTLGHLYGLLERAAGDRGCRAIVISARGPDFSRGMDFDLLLDESKEAVLEAADRFIETLSFMCRCRLPIVACVEGNVSGGGLGLLGASDVVIASPSVTFMLPEVIVGMVPALVTPFLLRRLSPARLKTMALSSRAVNTTEAVAWGLVDEIADEGVGRSLERQAKRILRSSPDAIGLYKTYLNDLCHADLEDQLNRARRLLDEWMSRPETVRQLRRFADGLAPSWFEKNYIPPRKGG